jgi:hypothetical protein
MNLTKRLKDPSDVIVEKTAGEFAATFFEASRSSGMGIITLQGQRIDLRKYKNNPRAFARAHIEKFIPAAVHALNEIMCNPKTPEDQRQVIYNALMERVNDVTMLEMGKAAGLPEFENSPLFKADTEKPKPVIVNTPSIDFDFDSKRTV